jgi:CubicO group peptidase (beta-lactamase class C family)
MRPRITPATRYAVVAALAFSAFAPLAFAQAPATDGYEDDRTLPDGPLGQRIQQVIDTINAGTPEAVEKLLKEACEEDFAAAASLQVHAASFAAVHRRTQGVEFYSIRRYSPPRPTHVAILRDKLTGGFTGLVLQMDPQPPHLLSGIHVTPARPPKDVPAGGPLTQAEAVRQWQDFLSKLASVEEFSGAVLLARGDEVLHRQAYGKANLSFDIPNQIDTKLGFGSMGKMFTAVAIAQLLDAGKIQLDDPASKYLDASWLARSKLSKIQIRHLLAHTAGLGSYFNGKLMEASRDRFRDLEDYQEIVMEEELAFEPGSRHQYSNTGFLLLGAIIEKVSGQSYDDYLAEHVFKPAGMVNTGNFASDEVVPNLATGYTLSPRTGQRVSNAFLHVIKGNSAGGGYSTVDDLFAFSRALQAGKLMKPETFRLFSSPKPEENAPNFGYGFGVVNAPKLGRGFGHSGGFPGISANMDVFPGSGWTIIILSNTDQGGNIAHQRIVELLSRVEDPAAAASATR